MKKYGLSKAESKALYKKMSKHYGRAVTRNTLRQHKRKVGEFVTDVLGDYRELESIREAAKITGLSKYRTDERFTFEESEEDGETIVKISIRGKNYKGGKKSFNVAIG
jgi:predicted ArsR family transcriptional regulator